MKLFGEYLVEKKLITDSILVSALIEQMKSLPTTAEIVLEKKLISVEQVLKIFRDQFVRKCSFVDSAKALNAWSSEISIAVEDHLATVRVPLGQVLIQMGSVSLEQVTHALDDFLSEIETTKEAQVPPPDVPASEVAAQDSSSYCDLFSDGLRSKIDSFFVSDSGKLATQEVIANVVEEVHRLKGGARLVGARLSEQLLTNLEQTLNLVLTLELSSFSPEQVAALKVASDQILQLLWKVKDDLRASGSECASDPARETEIQMANDQIQVLCFDLGFIPAKKAE